ncbi:active regulator of SIRT1 [Protopterus annectens]|uniref:active regulator of SIRT1 n=1 Tax=Protopterus annectens TaxID=7888 RepID=UPI001CF96733|nr:active regulator of SIRT1 [Protopterus annectens]
MSASLLRRGLELFDQDIRGGGLAAAKGKSASPPVSNARKRTKQQNSRLHAQKRLKNKATVKGKVIQSAVEEYRKRQPTSHFTENLQYMLSSRCATDSSVTEKVVSQNCGRKSKDLPNKKVEKKDEKSVFTEDDFRKFQLEYFGGGVGPI